MMMNMENFEENVEMICREGEESTLPGGECITPLFSCISSGGGRLVVVVMVIEGESGEVVERVGSGGVELRFE